MNGAWQACRDHGDILISEQNLIMLIECAVSYDRRLPYGHVPPVIWDSLSNEGQQALNDLMEPT